MKLAWLAAAAMKLVPVRSAPVKSACSRAAPSSVAARMRVPEKSAPVRSTPASWDFLEAGAAEPGLAQLEATVVVPPGWGVVAGGLGALDLGAQEFGIEVEFVQREAEAGLLGEAEAGVFGGIDHAEELAGALDRRGGGEAFVVDAVGHGSGLA